MSIGTHVSRPLARRSVGDATVGCLGIATGAFLAAAFSVQPLRAQEVASGFFDTIEVEIVNVEVYVTDRDGQPITGLQAEDFEILEDGEPVEITNFFAASARTGGGQGEAPAAEQLAQPVKAQAPLEVTPLEQQLNLVVFIDNQNISPKNRNRALKALRESLLTDLRPQDRVTLVNYDGSLNVLHRSSGDAQELAASLDRIAETQTAGMHTQMERVSILRSMQEADLDSTAALVNQGTAGFTSDNQDWGSVLSSIRHYMQEEHGRTVRTIRTLGGFVDALSSLEGRKALIYLSDGLPLRPGEALLEAFAQKASTSDIGIFNPGTETREFDATALFEQLGKRANASRVTFYTVLAAGGSPHTVTMAEQGAFVAAGNSGNQLGRVWDGRLEAIDRSNFKGSMEILAQSTGGLMTTSNRDFGSALRRLQKDFGTYYSLGYEASKGEDFSDHRLKVKVKRDGVRIRHRETFRLRSAAERMSVRTQSALVFDGATNPLGVLVEFGGPRQDDDGLFLVPVIVKFPINKIVLAPGEHSHDGQVSIFVGARSSKDGGLSPVQKMPAPIKIPNDRLMTALGQVAGYRMLLHLRPGEHSVAVSIRDEIALTESTSVVRYDPATAVPPSNSGP